VWRGSNGNSDEDSYGDSDDDSYGDGNHDHDGFAFTFSVPLTDAITNAHPTCRL
jgi:hypothetical protein